MLTTVVRPSGEYGRAIPLCPNCGRVMHHDALRSGDRNVFKCGECGIWALRLARSAMFSGEGLPEPLGDGRPGD